MNNSLTEVHPKLVSEWSQKNSNRHSTGTFLRGGKSPSRMKVRHELPAHKGYHGKQGWWRFRTILKYPLATDKATKRFRDNDNALFSQKTLQKDFTGIFTDVWENSALWMISLQTLTAGDPFVRRLYLPFCTFLAAARCLVQMNKPIMRKRIKSIL